jgi:DNA repair exonuclease SbcCD ATPase subunit
VLRVVGPGRKELGYRERIDELDQALGGVRSQLETAKLVERGSQRLIDRVEGDLKLERVETKSLRQAQARLTLGLGAVQAENEALRSENEALRRRVALLDAPAKSSWFARLLGR